MRVQVVLHESDILGLRIDLIHQPAHDLSIVLHGALRGHFHMPPPCQGFHHDKQIARATALVLVIDPFRMTWLHGYRRIYISMEHHRFFIETNSRILRIIFLFLEIEHVFHRRHKFASNRGQTPVLMLPGFQLIFLSNWWIVSGEMFVTKPNSTALFASKRTVQWSCPSGAGLQATAIR